jgi:acetyltransferase-like isoleucine patch superfamily enzyme
MSGANPVKLLISVLRRVFGLADAIHTALLVRLLHIEVGGALKVRGRLYVRSQGTIQIGRDVTINSSMASNPIGGAARSSIVVGPGAMLSIGDGARISNVAIMCRKRIDIGRDVYIGGDCRIWDTDFHPLAFEERISHPHAAGSMSPVRIGDGAFIGASCIILKGVTIGEKSVIGAGAVVTKPVPPGEIWAGNPARKIRSLEAEGQGTKSQGISGSSDDLTTAEE